MKSYAVVLTLALFIFMAPAPSQAAGAESFTVNGLKVIFAPNTSTDIIAANMYFRGGSAILDVKQAGIERLALAVAVEASKTYPREVLSAALERMDSRLNSSAGRDYSSVSLQCVARNFDESWKIFTDVLLNPGFDSSDVELERQRELSAIRQSEDNPDQYLSRLANEAFYVEHPYFADPAGTLQTIEGLTRQDLRSFIKGRLTTSQMLLVVVGNTSRAKLEQMVQTSFGSLAQGSFVSEMPPAVRHDTPSIKIVLRDLPTNYVVGYCSSPAFGSAASYAMNLAGSILYDREFEAVRTKRGLSYAPSAGIGGLFSNYGLLYVTAVKPDTTITVMIDEVKKMQAEPVPAKTLNDKRNVFLTNYYLTMETNQSQAERLARYELCGAGFDQVAHTIENFRKVTPVEIQNVCKEYMRNFQFVLLGEPATLHIAAWMF